MDKDDYIAKYCVRLYQLIVSISNIAQHLEFGNDEDISQLVIFGQLSYIGIPGQIQIYFTVLQTLNQFLVLGMIDQGFLSSVRRQLAI